MKNRTLFFGEGLFETFRVYPGGKLAFVKDHLDRMRHGCDYFSLPFSPAEALVALQKALRDIPKDTQARLRLNLISYGDHGRERVSYETFWEPLQNTGGDGGGSVALAMAPFPRFSQSPLVRFKTTSYLENISVFTKAREEGFFDALFTNEKGEITEGSISNIFFIEKNRIVTPPVDAGLLPGVTRKQVIALAQERGISLQETTNSPEDLGGFQGAFVTNSVVDIRPVMRIGSWTYDVPKVIHTLSEDYRRRVKESCDTFPEG